MAWWTKPGNHGGKSWWRKQEGKRALREMDDREIRDAEVELVWDPEARIWQEM